MILEFLPRSGFFLAFLANLIAKILAKNEKKIRDLGKKFMIIQDYSRSCQENQDAKHLEEITMQVPPPEKFLHWAVSQSLLPFVASSVRIDIVAAADWWEKAVK